MRKLLILTCFLAAACDQESGPRGNTGNNRVLTAPRGGPVQTATLTGLYESAGSPPSQLCITERGNAARFGLVTRQGGRAGCSGAGSATRSGSTLRLVMNGESACTIEARLDGSRVSFPAALPGGCSYYCAPGAGAGGAAFTKTGGTREDALSARDIVGDPLCGNPS